MRCAPRRDKRRLNWSLNLSFGWNHRSIPPPTAQFIALVSLTNSGTVPEFSYAQKRIDDLLGLAVPFRIAMQIREQTQMQTESSFDEALEHATDEELEVLRRVYERASPNPPTLEPPGKDPTANL
jgi:hypothetical protein